MRHITKAAVTMLSLLALSSCNPAQQPSGIEGTWQLASVKLTAPDTTATVESPGTGMLMFQGSRYSQVWMETGRNYASPPSELEKVDAFDTFDASAGTYTLENSTLILTPEIARDPNLVGVASKTTIQVSGETLIRTAERPDQKDASQKMTWTSTYTRVK